MSDPSELSASVKALLTDSDLALRYIDIAEATREEARREEAVRNARKAYHMICRKRPHFSFAGVEARMLDLRLEQLRIRLKRIGNTPS